MGHFRCHGSGPAASRRLQPRSRRTGTHAGHAGPLRHQPAGHARVAKMNRQVAGNLDKIIATLEDEGTAGEEASAGAS